ncbi:MAG: 3-hydroxy-3-methylglutaryl-CoA reductase, partial [Chloroflexota bacterium]|nr:3-hydroxy-3-methylglutaryl-CoA reductase [Chloroflexota bacterium]
MPLAKRQAIAESWAGLDEADLTALVDSGLSSAEAELLIENVIGRYSLPFAVATNFRINGHDTLVP